MQLQQMTFENIVTKRSNNSKQAISPFATRFSTFFSKYTYNYRDFPYFLVAIFKVVCCRFAVCGKELNLTTNLVYIHVFCNRCYNTGSIKTLSHKQHICSRRLWNFLGKKVTTAIIYEMNVWAISPFVTMFSKSSAAGSSESVHMWERVNEVKKL